MTMPLFVLLLVALHSLVGATDTITMNAKDFMKTSVSKLFLFARSPQDCDSFLWTAARDFSDLGALSLPRNQ